MSVHGTIAIKHKRRVVYKAELFVPSDEFNKKIETFVRLQHSAYTNRRVGSMTFSNSTKREIIQVLEGSEDDVQRLRQEAERSLQLQMCETVKDQVCTNRLFKCNGLSIGSVEQLQGETLCKDTRCLILLFSTSSHDLVP